jgi:hypothetical protein
MRAVIRRIGLCQLVVFCLGLSSAFCVTAGQTVKLEGYVVSTSADSVTMRTKDSSDVAVTVTEFTKVSTPKGWFGSRCKEWATVRAT